MFPGHEQPRLPADSASTTCACPRRGGPGGARGRHGIEAFCYWHYWFAGVQLLARPFAEVLASGEPDFPFCLGWANETWTRRWHGSGDGTQVLKAQTYSVADDDAHATWLARAFADPRYVRVHGRPLFLRRSIPIGIPERAAHVPRHWRRGGRGGAGAGNLSSVRRGASNGPASADSRRAFVFGCDPATLDRSAAALCRAHRPGKPAPHAIGRSEGHPRHAGRHRRGPSLP